MGLTCTDGITARAAEMEADMGSPQAAVEKPPYLEEVHLEQRNKLSSRVLQSQPWYSVTRKMEELSMVLVVNTFFKPQFLSEASGLTCGKTSCSCYCGCWLPYPSTVAKVRSALPT